AHQRFPFEALIDELRPDRSADRNPIFQVMFILQDAALEHPRLGDVGLRRLAADTGTAKFDLTLFAIDDGTGIRTVAEYSTDLFDEATVRRLLAHYHNVLRAIADDPGQPVSTVPLATGEERQALL